MKFLNSMTFQVFHDLYKPGCAPSQTAHIPQENTVTAVNSYTIAFICSVIETHKFNIFFTFGLVQGIFLSQNESFITYQVSSLTKKKMADMALNNPSSDSFQSLFCCSAPFSPTILRQRGFLDLQVEMLLTKSELSFSLEVVSAVSGSVVMVLQITSLTFS